MGQSTQTPAPFKSWLRGELDSRGWGVRTLAKRMNPGSPEVARRALNRYLKGSLPNDANRSAIARALGIEDGDMPSTDRSSDEDDEESDPMAVLYRAVALVVRHEANRNAAEKTEPAASLREKATAGSEQGVTLHA